jgi:fatty acid desaturase
MSGQATPAAAGRRRAILANPQDLHCVVYHLVTLAGYGAAFWIYLHPRAAGIGGRWSMAAFIATAVLLLGWCSGIDVGVNFHNHTHRKILRSAFLSRWFGRLWTFSGGWPSFFWHHAHVTVHHARTLHDDDWTLPLHRPDGSFESYHRYALLHWPWRYSRHFWQDFRARPELARRAAKELAIFLALWSIPFFIDPVMALWLWVLPQWFGNVVFLAPGMYVQHVRCVPKSATRPFNHSNTYLSRFFNLTMFNIGYHLEHHDNPGVHWSELPAFHQRIKEELIAGGVRVLRSGYFSAALIYGTASDRGDADRRFEAARHPSYPAPRPPGSGELTAVAPLAPAAGEHRVSRTAGGPA